MLKFLTFFVDVAKGDFRGDLGGGLRGLDLVWESATPPTHIWEKSPPKKFFFVGTFPNPFLHILLSSSLSSLQTYPCQHAWKPADQVPILQSQRERGWNCEHILSSLIIFSYFLSDAKHEIPLNNNHLFCLFYSLSIADCSHLYCPLQSAKSAPATVSCGQETPDPAHGRFSFRCNGWVSNILIGETSFEIHIWLLKNIFVCSLSLFHNFVDDAVCQIAAWRSVKSHKKFQWQDLLTGYKFDRFFWSGLAALLHMTKNVLHSGPSMYVGNWSWSRVLVKKEKSAK